MPRRVLTVVVLMLALIFFALQCQKNAGDITVSELVAAVVSAPTAIRPPAPTPASGDRNNVMLTPASTESARTTIQKSSAIRETAFHSSQSNDPYLVIAALDGLIYCADVGGSGDVSAETHAAKSFWISLNLVKVNVSSIEARTQAVFEARERCDAKNAEVVALDGKLRLTLSEKLTAYNQLLTEIRKLPDLDLNALSLGSKTMLLGGNGTALFSVVDQLTTKLIGPGATESEMFAAILATQLAACQLGDACDQRSFRKQFLCFRWGACEGANVEAALGALLADRSDLQQSVASGAARLRQSLQSVKK